MDFYSPIIIDKSMDGTPSSRGPLTVEVGNFCRTSGTRIIVSRRKITIVNFTSFLFLYVYWNVRDGYKNGRRNVLTRVLRVTNRKSGANEYNSTFGACISAAPTHVVFYIILTNL